MDSHRAPRACVYREPGLWRASLSGATLALAILVGLAGLEASPAGAQQMPSAPVQYDSAFFAGLSYRNVGPERGGRSTAVAGSASRPFEYYFGATGGGLWKTTDGGLDWEPVTDGQITSSSVGAVQVCEANPDVVYMGMGETEFRGNIMQGDGVYKSTDAGATWTHVGLEETQTIARIRIHPTNCDVVYVAALGHAFGPNPERGVFRSSNGGQSWDRVLFRDEDTGVVDLVMDPSNPNTLIAGFWQVYRTSWGMYSGGPGGGMFKTTDGGDNWTELTRNPGLPEGIWGKIGVAISGADSNRVYAIIEAENGGVFRSDDGGATWTQTNDERNLRQRAFYYTRIYADPQERETVYVMNTGFYKSTDGGETFPGRSNPPHGDQHDLWIASNDNQRMINSNDGGANVSVNGGETWTDQDYPTAQLYHITTTNHIPYWVCGAQQDNSTACMPSSGWGQIQDYFGVGGGESGYIASDPENPFIFYAGSYGGQLTRYDFMKDESETINVWPDNPMGYSSEDITERFQWTFPIVFSRTGPKRLYVGSQHLWMTTTEGKSWERISPDLTRADPSTLGPSGGPITKDQTGVETYGTIFAIAPSPHDANTIWVGSDDGYVQLTRDQGQTWTNVTPPDMADFSRISLIEVSPHRPGAAYVAAKRYQLDDRDPYIYTTEDYGATWKRIDAGIPSGDYVHAVREDPVRPYLLYAGTEHGLQISFDNGLSWSDFRLNLPDVQVPNLMVKGNDLAIATHGRSAYILSGLDRVRQLSAQVVVAQAHLFDPPDVRIGLENSVPITYNLRQPAEQVTIEFVGPSGEVVRTYTAEAEEGGQAGRAGGGRGGRGGRGGGGGGRGGRGGGGGGAPSVSAGMNTFNWNMAHEDAVSFPGMIMWAAGTGGPRVGPGQWQVRLRVDDMPVQTQQFEIQLDPRYPDITIADHRAREELALRIRDRVSEANQAVIDIRDVESQVSDRIEQDASLDQAATPLRDGLNAVEEQIYQVRNQSSQDPLNFPIMLNNKLAGVLRAVEGAIGRPTQQSYQVFDELSGRLQVELDRLDVIYQQELAEFNRLLQERGLPPIQIRRGIAD